MEQKRVINCIFEDTPKECSSITLNNECLGLNKLRCLFNHSHLVIAENAKAELTNLFQEEINSKRRFKHLSGHK